MGSSEKKFPSEELLPFKPIISIAAASTTFINITSGILETDGSKEIRVMPEL